MASRTIKLPDVGEGVAEAELVEWHVAPGDDVAEDQVLAAVTTDKATVEIPSPFAGRVIRLGGTVGAKLAVGSVLVEIETATQHGERPALSKVGSLDGVAAHAIGVPVEPSAMATAPGDSQSQAALLGPRAIQATLVSRGKVVASPALRRRALESGVDLRLVPGTGPAGRVSAHDFDRYVKDGQHRSGGDRVDIIKLAGVRRTISERMANATKRIAHFSYIEEVDVTALEELRADLNGRYGEKRGRLTVLPFILRAIVVAVREFPQMNCLYDDDAQTLSQFEAVHVGIATQTSVGLMVPVLKAAEKFSLWECAEEIVALAEAARSGRASRSQLTGSTITITSLGELGGIATTPVVNWPEVAIVGVNRIAVRPVWQNGQFVPRRMMNLSSSFDHRVIDGDGAARFVRRIKQLLELPANLFIEDE